MFEDSGEKTEVVAAYDHLEDAIVFNPDHDAWFDIRRFTRDRKKKDLYSTAHPQHIVRHELGHAAYYHALAPEKRASIWLSEALGPGELSIARRVSGRAAWNPKEFVAEVFAGLWGGVDYDDEVIALFEHYGGQRP
jgi:hypothetical protein